LERRKRGGIFGGIWRMQEDAVDGNMVCDKDGFREEGRRNSKGSKENRSA
jgi:hypothetical protein